jgi:hypothetical protein
MYLTLDSYPTEPHAEEPVELSRSLSVSFRVARVIFALFALAVVLAVPVVAAPLV